MKKGLYYDSNSVILLETFFVRVKMDKWYNFRSNIFGDRNFIASLVFSLLHPSILSSIPLSISLSLSVSGAALSHWWLKVLLPHFCSPLVSVAHVFCPSTWPGCFLSHCQAALLHQHTVISSCVCSSAALQAFAPTHQPALFTQQHREWGHSELWAVTSAES